MQVSASQEADAFIFSVADNGIGVGEADREQIFQKFVRGVDPKSRPGSGIGLATCRKIVERHHGRIWVTSEPGRGSTFHFSLPRMSGAVASRSRDVAQQVSKTAAAA